jgi:hypothetical protein
MVSPDSFSIKEVVRRIIKLNTGISKFWSNAEGWAPIEAAHLLNKSRLDWQVSLSHCLELFINNTSKEQEKGHLILAWTNLGSLVEGTMKLFLSVWYRDYKKDVNAIRKKNKLQDPDGLQLEPLRQFFKKRIWDDDWDKWVKHIQQRRNAIHAYKNREIGTKTEFFRDIKKYLEMLRYINRRLPYPDDIYSPGEH